MIQKLFSPNSPFNRFMIAVGELMVLNLLWIFTSIPIFTAGAATTALYAVMFSYAEKKEGYIVRSYFREFKRNFKKATALWLIILGIGVFMYTDLYLMSVMHEAVHGVLAGLMTGIFTIILCIDVLILLYVFPMQARYENSIPATLGKSVAFCFGYFGYTFQMIGYLLLPLGILMMIGMFTGRRLSWAYLFYIFIGVSATVFFLVKGPWKRLIKKIEPDDPAQINEEG